MDDTMSVPAFTEGKDMGLLARTVREGHSAIVETNLFREALKHLKQGGTVEVFGEGKADAAQQLYLQYSVEQYAKPKQVSALGVVKCGRWSKSPCNRKTRKDYEE